MSNILVLYYSTHGATEELAVQVARGVESVEEMEAKIRTVTPVSGEGESREFPPPAYPYADMDDLRDCDGLALGAATRFGNMPAAMKYFIDGTSELWMEGALVDKPAGVFTSTSSMHGGQESTLLTMMLPLLHHGMIICGVPYTESGLMDTQSGGTPYGPSRVKGLLADKPLTEHEKQIARALGKRLAVCAMKLAK